jgi:hypothetical protein
MQGCKPFQFQKNGILETKNKIPLATHLYMDLPAPAPEAGRCKQVLLVELARAMIW